MTGNPARSHGSREHNHTPAIILRSVTDLVDEHGDATYGDADALAARRSEHGDG